MVLCRVSGGPDCWLSVSTVKVAARVAGPGSKVAVKQRQRSHLCQHADPALFIHLCTHLCI